MIKRYIFNISSNNEILEMENEDNSIANTAFKMEKPWRILVNREVNTERRQNQVFCLIFIHKFNNFLVIFGNFMGNGRLTSWTNMKKEFIKKRTRGKKTNQTKYMFCLKAI